jgi:hypothetical protein
MNSCQCIYTDNDFIPLCQVSKDLSDCQKYKKWCALLMPSNDIKAYPDSCECCNLNPCINQYDTWDKLTNTYKTCRHCNCVHERAFDVYLCYMEKGKELHGLQ